MRRDGGISEGMELEVYEMGWRNIRRNGIGGI